MESFNAHHCNSVYDQRSHCYWPDRKNLNHRWGGRAGGMHLELALNLTAIQSAEYITIQYHCFIQWSCFSLAYSPKDLEYIGSNIGAPQGNKRGTAVPPMFVRLWETHDWIYDLKNITDRSANQWTRIWLWWLCHHGHPRLVRVLKGGSSLKLSDDWISFMRDVCMKIYRWIEHV